MLKIGDFSKLAHVTVKALRHYAERGLLRPAWVDRFTGYRYYSLEQLPRLNRILALKDLGFSLDQVRQLLDSQLNASQLRSMLGQKQGELQQRLQSEQDRLGRVEARLRQIEQESQAVGLEVALKRMPALRVACARQVIPSIEAVPQWTSRLTGEIRTWLLQSGLRADGPWLVINHNPEYTERSIDLELAAVIDARPGGVREVPLPGRVSLSTLPQVETMACTAKVGGRSTLPQTYAGLYAWLELNAYRACGPSRELHLSDHADDSQAIEVQLPVEPAFRSIFGANLNHQEKNKMEPKFVSRPAFTVVGMPYVGKNEKGEISQLWNVFNPRSGEIPHIIDGEAYGVCLTPADSEPGVFEYIAGLAVEGPAEPPQDMVVRTVPAQKYAVFTHHGPLDTLMQTYSYIFQVWLPQSGRQWRKDMDMEVYDNRFNIFAPDSEFDIYIPILD